jgi:hypothetical protein
MYCPRCVPQGSATVKSKSDGSSTPAKPLEPKTREGLSLSDAQDKALKLQPGMAQTAVTELFGKPDETSSGTYGSQTPKPWNGVTWVYRWTRGLSSKRLSVVFQYVAFQQGGGAWVVNSWNWYDF